LCDGKQIASALTLGFASREDPGSWREHEGRVECHRE
jgi:hypothetical protein